MREDLGWCTPRLKGLLAILHGTVKGGAYSSTSNFYTANVNASNPL